MNTPDTAPPASGDRYPPPQRPANPILRLSRRIADRFRTSLRARVSLLMVLIFVGVSVPAYLAVDRVITTAIVQLGTLFAERQVLFDRYRGLETLMREASLAETLARSPAIVDWAADEASPERRARGLAELEHYRTAFRDGSYFFVVGDSGNYYFNNRENAYHGRQLRYRVERENPRDGWYFATVAGPPGCRLNVDNDDNLRVTKVWVNCTVVREGRTVGVVGTGIDLTSFIREVVDTEQVGVESVFVDRSGAIQAHPDPRLIDFHSLTKDAAAKNTIFRLLDRPEDRTAVAGMIERVAAGEASVATRFVRIDGREVLAGIGYLDRIGWFNVTLMDIDRIIDRDLFRPLIALLAIILAAATVLATWLFKRIVLDRLALLEIGVGKMRAGDFKGVGGRPGADEIGRLTRAFGDMAGEVGSYTQRLEEEVRARTLELERLAHVDLVTNIYNRRGFLRAADGESNRADRSGLHLGMILIDLDLFKKVNDRFGHRAGDAVLAEVARRLSTGLRSYDIVARWGGDEFIMLVSVKDAEVLRRIAGKILSAIRDTPFRLPDGTTVGVTVSIGATLLEEGASLDTIVARADDALYEAKKNGRNRVAFTPAPERVG